MGILDAIRTGLSELLSHKLRSVLTMLGIVVGIFSIISVMTALSVLQNSVEQGMTQLGAKITSTEAALFELLKVAKGDKFKAISQIVR